VEEDEVLTLSSILEFRILTPLQDVTYLHRKEVANTRQSSAPGKGARKHPPDRIGRQKREMGKEAPIRQNR
jgi:hypothetical protein